MATETKAKGCKKVNRMTTTQLKHKLMELHAVKGLHSKNAVHMLKELGSRGGHGKWIEEELGVSHGR